MVYKRALKIDGGMRMGYKQNIRRLCVGALFFVLACTESPFGRTEKISEILASPSKYSEKKVTVKGKVTESIIAFGVGYFVVSDGTDSIAVIPSKTFPKVGEEVKIKGMVKNAFVIGDKSLTVVVEEK